MKNEIKVLLLGTGESGKTTVVKQMQILYKDGFNKKTQILFRDAIRNNLKKFIELLLEAVDRLELKLKKSNKIIAETFTQLNSSSEQENILSKKMVHCIVTLWSDPALKTAYKNRFNFQIPDNANVYLDNTLEISKHGYIPNNQDILGCRIPTTGINEISFHVKNFIWTIIDVGGQRNERRKWIHQFEEVLLLIFIVAINEYNQRLFEDETVNRLQESLKLFTKMVNNEYFRHKNCILLFNKMDLFEEKISKYDLNGCFPDYKSGLDCDDALLFITKKFKKPSKNSKRKIYLHKSCATNTQNIKSIFYSVKEIVTQEFINQLSFL
ncbi:guanine nucleotide-binding protein g(o) subunit alpha [Anaeramoeba flamelloides]|uniref:Guanine nucleotide-binding protein g(O) subunit alpha n=1 Tax=Anaeramoeba flamelloides TaxID=1746091 RepID=A0AAV7ZYB6_9EUKA|nr:guanine nucleotide-binding protein g(o) subunit alpha [Anaeramoeba flamelloides]